MFFCHQIVAITVIRMNFGLDVRGGITYTYSVWEQTFTNNFYLFCSGIRCTGEGFCQYIDYCIIEELKPDFRGEESVSGLFLLEKIPPPSPTAQYIQVHRLSGNENLSHLLLAYHHYGAAKAVVFVNTSDEFQLHQDLLNTLPASSEEYSKLLSVLIPKKAGTDLVMKIHRPSSRCEIHSASVDLEQNLEQTETTIAPTYPSPAEKGLYIKAGYFAVTIACLSNHALCIRSALHFVHSQLQSP